MAEYPIIFSSEMVKAILDGQKTQTRRIIKTQPPTNAEPCTCSGITHFYIIKNPSPKFCESTHNTITIKWPYGGVGSLLWVKESFCYAKLTGYDARKDGGEFWYRATDRGECEGPYTSSRYMPKDAARIWLEVTNIKVERLQEISQDDAMKEGCSGYYKENCHITPKAEFHNLWDFLNAKRGFGWDINPWLWVIEFRKIKG